MKIVLVTGGTKGIGFECVKRYCQNGHKVITCSRQEKDWEKMVELYEDLKNVDYVKCDVSKEDDLNRLFNYINVNYKKLDIAINNASPKIQSLGKLKDVPINSLRSTLESDFWSYVLCIKHELGLMGFGSSIVNVSSVNGLRPNPGGAMYGSAKHGIEALTKSVALEAVESGIKINAVAPGVTWTERWETRKEENPNIKLEVEPLIPIKRFASVSEIVDAIEWLNSDQSSYVIGHTLVVDGGLSLK